MEFENSIPAMAQASARRFGSKPALIDGSVELTFVDVADQMVAVAAGLVAMGVRPGDRVAIWAPNTASYVSAVLGIQAAGAWMVPINSRFRGEEAAFILDKVDASALFTVDRFLDSDYIELLKGADASLRCLDHVIDLPGPGVLSTPGWEAFTDSGRSVSHSEIQRRIDALGPDDVSDVIFTSGTTGLPKGVMLRHGPSLEHFGGQYSTLYELDETARQLVVLPFFHCFGYKAGWMAALNHGAATYPLAVFDPLDAIRIIDEAAITHMPGSPTMFSAILDHPDRSDYDLSSLHVTTVSAATVPAALIHRMLDELGIDRNFSGYGLTENHALVSLSSPDDSVELITTTSGRILDIVDYRVVDDDGNDLPAGEEGELLVSGPLVMSGYYEEPEATAATVIDGWLHTGDIVRVTADRYVTITDRKKDIYIMGGFNVSPAEVEKALAAAPGVAQVAVVGTPDDQFGEVGVAFVIPLRGHSPTPEDVIAYAEQHLANFKVPRRVVLTDEFPLNATGKVLKYLLRHRLATEPG